jgi:hypothetical protein
MKVNIKILAALLFFLNFSMFSSNIKIFIILNDNSLASSDVKKIVDYIYFKNKFKVFSFTILHFSQNSEEQCQWKFKKKLVDYKPTKTDCNFSICDNLIPILKYEKSEKTKFFNCESVLPCSISNIGIETTNLSNKNESTIIEKINDEVELNRKSNKDLTLFFYLSGKELTTKPTVTLPLDSIILTDPNTSISINPIYSSNFAKYFWNPKLGLSCSDCRYPKVSIDKRTVYSISGVDSTGCASNTATIIVDINKVCQDGYGKCDILFGTPEKPISVKFEHTERSKAVNYDWIIHANQSGNAEFEIITEPNCGTSFKLLIYDQKNNTIWQGFYDRADVDIRSRSNYHKIFPKKFVFKLNLKSIQGILKNTEMRQYRIEIQSFDEKNNTYEIYKSPHVYFSNC